MSLWDDFVQKVQGAGQAVGSTFLKAVGLQPSATLPLAQSLVQQEAVKSGMSVETAQALTNQSFNKIGALNAEQVGTQVVTPLDKYVYQPTFQALSAGVLLTNPDTFTNEDEYTNALSRAWAGSKEIPFGQAVADMAAYYSNMLPDWGPLADLNKVDVNIYDKEIREKIYTRLYDENGNRVNSQGQIIPSGSWVENVFMGLSAGADITKQLVFDPLVWLGKGANAARLKVLNVKSPEFVVKDPAKFNETQARAADQTNKVYQEQINLTKNKTELNRVKDFIKAIDDGIPTQATIIKEVDNVRAAAGKDPLPPETPLDTYIKQYKNYAASLEKQVAKSEQKIEDLNVKQAALPEVAPGVQEFARQIVTRKMTWEEINRHAVVNAYAIDKEFLSKALEQAARRGEEAVYDVFMLAQGDPTAALRLAGQHADLLKIIDDAQTRLDDMEVKIQEALYQQEPATVQALNIQKKKLSELITAMRKDDVYLDRLIGPNSTIVGSLPTAPFSGNLTVRGKDIQVSPIVEKWRADRAIVKAGVENGTIKLRDILSPSQEYIWTRVQRSPLHRIVYVAQWAGSRLGREKPSGWITIDGLDAFEGVRDLRASLNDTPVFDDMPQLKDKFMSDYVGAKDGPARAKVLDEVEKEIFAQTAKYFGADEVFVKDNVGNNVPLSEVLYEKFKDQRGQAVAKYMQDKVFGIDTNQTMIANPIVESQLAYARPMLDSRELFKFFKYNMPDKSAWTVATGSIKKVKDEWVLPAWITVDRLWRADVLLRLGYPKKNIASELMVLSMYDFGLKGMYSGGVIPQATKNFLDNRHAQFIDMQSAIKSEIEMARKQNKNITAAVLSRLKPRRVDWTRYEEFHSDVIKKLREDKEIYVNHVKEITEHPDAYDISFKESYEIIDGFDELIAIEEAKLAAIANRVLERGERFGSRKIIGKKRVFIRGHEFAGIYEGLQGDAVRILTGSGGRINFDISPLKALYKELGVETTDGWRIINPDDKTYFVTLADIVNKQFRGSNTMNMILRGEPMAKVIEYLETPRGKAELERLNWIYDKPIKGAKTRKAGWPLEEELVLGKDGSEEIRTKFVEELDQTPAENYYHFLVDEVVKNYFPTEEMRTLIANKLKVDEFGRGAEDVTSAELRLAAKDAQLNPIHGEAIEELGVLQKPDSKKQNRLSRIVFDVVIKNGYKFLGEYPEDAAITHPFGNAVYQNKLDEIAQTWEANNIMPTSADIVNAEFMARKWAIQQTREFLYRVTRRNGIANSIPVIAPFLEAQLSTMRRSGKLAYRNPDKAARLIWLWNQINTNAYKDEDGNRWLSFTIPKAWYDENGVSSVMPKNLRNAIAANDTKRWSPQQFNLIMMGLRIPEAEVLPGETETTQQKVARWAKTAQSIIGTGWTVQIAANEILRQNPYIDQQILEEFGIPLPARDFLETFASPYPTENWFDPLTSAWNKRVISLLTKDEANTKITEFVFGKNNADFERHQLIMVQWHLDQQRLGLEEPLSDDPAINAELLFDQASKEATWTLLLRLWTNLTAGFVPSTESSTITPLVEEYRRYQTKYGVQAFDKWLEHHPDLAYIAVSRTKNLTGSSQSTDAAWLRKRHDGIIEDAIKETGLPREDALAFVQMVTNKNIDAAILRDPYAGYWLRQEGDRVTLSAEEGFENNQVRLGWAWFMDMQDEINVALNSKNMNRYSVGANRLNVERQKEIDRYAAENPQWYAEYSTLTGASASVGFVRAMFTVLADEDFRETLPEDSFWWNIEEIITTREEMIQAARNAGLNAPNQRMKEVYLNDIAGYLKDPTTAYYFNKFLDNDSFDLAYPGGM